MQMAKISAVTCHQSLFIIYFSTNITYNRRCNSKIHNVRRSNFAEPKAVIGFAGRRVIEQTLQEQLQIISTAEYLLHHGLIDLIICVLLKQALSETLNFINMRPSRWLYSNKNEL
jgi:acetyl-CoA carboxylase carboxyl transferase subunit beta